MCYVHGHNTASSAYEQVRVTLISRDVMTPYSGMIPGHVAGFYTHEECHIDLLALCRFAGVRFVHAAAVGLEPAAGGGGTVVLEGRPGLRYDVLSVNTGSSPQMDPAVASVAAAAAAGGGGDGGVTVTPVRAWTGDASTPTHKRNKKNEAHPHTGEAHRRLQRPLGQHPGPGAGRGRPGRGGSRRLGDDDCGGGRRRRRGGARALDAGVYTHSVYSVFVQ
jgi:hypothetical protein